MVGWDKDAENKVGRGGSETTVADVVGSRGGLAVVDSMASESTDWLDEGGEFASFSERE